MNRFSLLGAAVLGLVFCGAVFAEAAPAPATIVELNEVTKQATEARQAGDTAWMLVSTALVMLMVPGLALFYGGMVRRKASTGSPSVTAWRSASRRAGSLAGVPT
jgi:hypothetical protein